MEPPWSLIDGGRFPGLSAVSVRDKAKLGSRGVYLISIYTLECGSSLACVTQNYNWRNSTNISLRAWAELRHRRQCSGRPRNRLTTRLDKTFYIFCVWRISKAFLPEDTWIYLHLILKYAWLFIFSSQTRLAEAWLGLGGGQHKL